MSRKSRFIGTSKTGNLSALGNQQQRDYNFISNLLDDENILKYFAEPVLNQNQEKIDWYTDADGRPKGFHEFTDQEINTARDELGQLMKRIREKASAARTDLDREAILNLCVLPDQDSIKKVGDQIVIINWAYQLHKRQRSEATSENFAGFADQLEDKTPPAIDPNKRTISSETENTQINEKLPHSPDTEKEEKPETIKDQEDGVDAEEIEEQEPNSEEFLEKPESPDEEEKSIKTKPFEPAWPTFLKNKWLWIALFLLLLILNILMLKDACGVKSIPFLYFC
jgi:hypothetical protein